VRKLIDEYGAAVAARAKAEGEPDPCGSRAAARAREAKAREALEDAITQAACIVSQALGDVEAIDAAKPLKYADDPSYDGGTNFSRKYNERRAFTLKDARPYARCASRMLRQVWEILDPSSHTEASR
jgi:ABC-type molybdate transport system substrate-binding protein